MCVCHNSCKLLVSGMSRQRGLFCKNPYVYIHTLNENVYIVVWKICYGLNFILIAVSLHWLVQLCQRLTEYGVHLHHVLPEKRSQTGILLGVCCKGVVIFEVHNGARTPVLRFPWRETKKISFSVSWALFLCVCTSIFVSAVTVSFVLVVFAD